MRSVLICVLLLAGCGKSVDRSPAPDFTTYTIRSGEHYATTNPYKAIEVSELRFVAQFDSSAVYETVLPENQADINKLYGFSDNAGEHHRYSARFGWRWSGGALRLFAYVYNDGAVLSEELSAIPIGAEIRCRIEVKADRYVFYCNEAIVSLPRKSTTQKGKGYQLYPYFGGNEPAPHEVTIRIKDESL